MKTFVQTGDFHLDCPIRVFENSSLRRTELHETVSHIFRHVRQDGIDYMFLTGDIFDNDLVSEDTLEFLHAQMESVPDTHIFISPGNHDFVGRNSAWTEREWPSNVHIFNQFETVMESELSISGAGFTQMNEPLSIIPENIVIPEDRPSILICHGVQRGYNPVDASLLQRFSYCALGHVHNHVVNGNMVYAGAPYGRSFNECGRHGFIRGTIDGGRITALLTEIPGRIYDSFDIELSDTLDLKDNGDLERIISERLTDRGLRSEDIIRVRFLGHMTRYAFINEEYLKSQLVAFPNLTLDFSGLRTLDMESLEDEDTLTGRFMKALKEKETESEVSEASSQEEDRGEVVRRMALELGLKALTGYLGK